MAYVQVYVDIEEYLDEVNLEYLVDEIKKRAKKEKKSLSGLFNDSTLRGNKSKLEEIAEYLGLNRYASKEDIINEINKL